jgi:hypothetical protein
MACAAGRVKPVNPARLLAHSVRMEGMAATVEGRDGMEVSGLVKLKALVMSPTVARLHALRFGTSAPKRVSRKRSIEV